MRKGSFPPNLRSALNTILSGFKTFILHGVGERISSPTCARLSEMTGSKEEKQDYQVMAEELLLKVPWQEKVGKDKTGLYFV